MTSTPFTSGDPNTDGHPDVADISALTEGVLSPERSADVRAHVAECSLCADVENSLQEIQGALGTLPGPTRMPADIAGRIDAALAAEALLDASSLSSAPAQGSPVSRETGSAAEADAASTASDAPEPGESEESVQHHIGSPSRSGDRAPDQPAPVSRETGARRTAASSRGESRTSTRPPGRSSAGAGPGRDRNTQRSGRRWRRALLAGAGAVVLLGIGGIAVQSFSSSSSSETSAASDSSRADTALRHHVDHLLAKNGSHNGDTSTSPRLKSTQSPSADSTMTGGTSTVPSCVRKGIGRTESPVAADSQASYKSHRGYLVVYPHRGDKTHRVDAYLVNSSCVSGDGGSTGKVLVKRTYPRH